MTVVVLCKWSRDPDDVEIGTDGAVSFDRAAWELFEYDRVAIELGVTLAAGAPVVALSAGATEIDTTLARKAILSRGVQELFLVSDDRLAAADAGMTGAALAAAVKQIGDVNVVVAGAGSADLYAQQVGIQVGSRLDWYTVNEVTGVSLDGDAAKITRRVGSVTETLNAPLPVAVSLTADAATPRNPGMRDILSAGKKPTTVWSLDDLGVTVEPAFKPLSTAPRGGVSRQQTKFEGSTAATVQQLVEALRRDGIVGRSEA